MTRPRDRLRRFFYLLLYIAYGSCTPDLQSIDESFVKTPSVCIDITPQQLTDYLASDVYDDGDRPLLFGYNSINSSLDVFSLSDRSIVRTIQLSQTGPSAINDVIAVKVTSSEVIWFATPSEFMVYDLELKSVSHRISLSDLNDKFTLAKYSYFFDNHGELVALNDSSMLVQAGFFPLYNGGAALHLSVMNVNNGKMEDLPVRIPGWVNGGNHFGALNAIQYGYSDDEIHYSFPFSDSLYKYSLTEEKFLPAQQYDSPDLPTVLETYKGNGEMEALVDYASASSFYMGIQKVDGREDTFYRFIVIASDEQPVTYTTKLEIFVEERLLARQEICTWCKTRSFTIADTIFMFKEGASESQLCFETVLIPAEEQ